MSFLSKLLGRKTHQVSKINVEISKKIEGSEIRGEQNKDMQEIMKQQKIEARLEYEARKKIKDEQKAQKELEAKQELLAIIKNEKLIPEEKKSQLDAFIYTSPLIQSFSETFKREPIRSWGIAYCGTCGFPYALCDPVDGHPLHFYGFLNMRIHDSTSSIYECPNCNRELFIKLGKT